MSSPPSRTRVIQTPSRVTAIVNPGSGGGDPSLGTLNEALKRFDSEIFITQAAGDGERFCREAIKKGTELVIAYGGDGTILEIINGLAGTEIPLLVIRGGTGNVIADELQLPQGVDATLALLQGETLTVRSVDLGIMNGSTYFALRCGCGLEVNALQQTEHSEKSDWGKWAYVSGFLKAIAEQEIIDFQIWIDDSPDPIHQSGVALTVANAGRLGVGSMQIAPNVSMTDGLLDICLVEKAVAQTLLQFFSLQTADSENTPDLATPSLVHVQKVRRVRIETARPVQFQADGDIVGETPLEIEVRPAAACLVIDPSKAE